MPEAIFSLIFLTLFSSGTPSPIHSAPWPPPVVHKTDTATTYDVNRVLEVGLRFRDNNGARWMHNRTAIAKGLYLDFGGTCDGCKIVYPRSARENPAEVLINNHYYIPGEGRLRFQIPDQIKTITARLTDEAGNKLYIEDDDGENNHSNRKKYKDASHRTKQVNINNYKLNNHGGFLTDLTFIVKRDDLFSRLLAKGGLL
jgi:hypothetical protein